jgi:hypothetical protein
MKKLFLIIITALSLVFIVASFVDYLLLAKALYIDRNATEPALIKQNEYKHSNNFAP